MGEEYLLEMTNIVKTFPGVKALSGVNLQVKIGEVHGLMGENGAGKSTLMKCLIGIQPITSGEIYFNGKKLDKFNTSEALLSGISMIHQELSPIHTRSIMENIWLNREPRNKLGLINHKKMYDMSVELLKRVDLDIDPKTEIKNISVAKIQLIEIAKAISYDAKLLIMDEPTSALTSKEINQLFKIIYKLKEEGKSIIYISHKLDEIYEITERITVLCDGNYIGSEDTNKLHADKLINMMVGREVKELYPKTCYKTNEVMLEIKNFTSNKFKNISFDVKKGEILGISGLIGSGRTELIDSIFGLSPVEDGEILIHGKKAYINSPKDAINNRMAYLTEDRKLNGILPSLSIKDNIIIVNIKKYLNKLLLINKPRVTKDVENYIDKISIKTPHHNQKIEYLSGGNQQKVLIARWLLTKPDILFLDEPTRGIDIGAKSEIYKLMLDLAKDGKSIIMVSSELPEILGMSDRVLIMHEGNIKGILDNNENLTQEEIMRYTTDTVNIVENEVGR
ncbi:MAG: sugar ABC transporter ATP-binding protein [Lachnospirales bacterium]